eukprot:3373712-Amphidinium_carterae.1
MSSGLNILDTQGMPLGRYSTPSTLYCTCPITPHPATAFFLWCSMRNAWKLMMEEAECVKDRPCKIIDPENPDHFKDMGVQLVAKSWTCSCVWKPARPSA